MICGTYLEFENCFYLEFENFFVLDKFGSQYASDYQNNEGYFPWIYHLHKFWSYTEVSGNFSFYKHSSSSYLSIPMKAMKLVIPSRFFL